MNMTEPLKQIRDKLAGEVAYYETIQGVVTTVTGNSLQSPNHQAAVARLRAFDELCYGAGCERVAG